MLKNKKRIETDIDYNELFDSEEEKNRVLALPELEREEILMEKYDEYQKKIDRENLLKYEDFNKKTNRQKEALNDIKNRKLQKVTKHASSESGEISDEYELSSVISLNAEQKNETPEIFNLTIEELEKIRIKREFFEKYHDYKDFDQLVKGSIVRLNFGNKKSAHQYMLAFVKEIVTNKDEPYKIGDRKYDKFFIAKHAELEKKLSFAIVSNGKIEQFEFDKLISRMEKANLSLINSEYIKQKDDDLEKIRSYNPTNAEVLKNIDEKKKLKIKNRDSTLNITYEFSHLHEHYEATKQRIREIEDDISKSLNKSQKDEMREELKDTIKTLEELEDLMRILTEMQENRTQETRDKIKNELTYRINQRNLLKQKETDLMNRFLSKKRNQEEENLANPYKRRECNPMSLFSTKKQESRLKIHDIKMTKVDDDPHVGTPKELYERRLNDIKLNLKLFEKFNEEFKIISDKSISQFINNTYNLQKSKKGFFGLLKSAKVNINEYIEYENNQLMKLYDVDINNIKLFKS